RCELIRKRTRRSRERLWVRRIHGGNLSGRGGETTVRVEPGVGERRQRDWGRRAEHSIRRRRDRPHSSLALIVLPLLGGCPAPPHLAEEHRDEHRLVPLVYPAP